jgi:phosphopentomutase
VIPLDELYEICRTARALLVPPNGVGRVIARPFVGDPSSGFTRTANRKDLPIAPAENMIDDIARECGEVLGIGVIPEVFAGRGFRTVHRTQTNAQHYGSLLDAMASDARFIWANFEDFDMLYGHRNDAKGFARALVTFDGYLTAVLERLRPEDLLILTADHGNDPTTPSTDHSREYVPVSLWHLGIVPGSFGDRDGFWHIGATVCSALGVPPKVGGSLLV